MKKNRNRTEIVTKILETVYGHDGNYNGEDEEEEEEEGITQTKIRYEVYLSRVQLREYLIALTLHGLLIYDSEMRRYHITEKSTRFLHLWRNISDIANKSQEQQEQQHTWMERK